MHIVLTVLIGLAAGYLGSLIMKGTGQGLVLNLIIGLVGSVIGASLFRFLGVHGGGLLWQLISATIGAIALIWVVSRMKGKK